LNTRRLIRKIDVMKHDNVALNKNFQKMMKEHENWVEMALEDPN
jgi:hypothetical protein